MIKDDYCHSPPEGSRGFLRCYRESDACEHLDGVYTLRLELYVDDYPIPCGSNKSVLAVYLTLNNFPFCAVTKRAEILPICYVERADIKEYSLVKCLEPVLNEIKQLELAQDFGLDKPVRVKLSAVLGDNKGINELIGISIGFSGANACRMCHITKQEIVDNPDTIGLLRTELS